MRYQRILYAKERGITMYCKNCGYELDANAKFCRKCGAKIQEDSVHFQKKNLEKIKASYKKDTDELKIVYQQKVFDTTQIKNVPIEQWVYPFLNNGIKWNGLYEELKTFSGCDEFILQFDSDEDSFTIVKNALASQPVKLIGMNNTVVIVYSENPFTTKITINGKIFDTTLLQNRCIDEWIQPFQIRNIQWHGIFKELGSYIGTDKYTIYFMGEQKFITSLIDVCPETVSIFYKAKPTQKAKTMPNIHNIDANKINIDNLSDMAKKTVSTIKQKINIVDSDSKENISQATNPELSMKWYAILSKYGMIFYMILSCIGVIMNFVMMSMVGFGTDFMIYAICYAVAAIEAYFLRKRLLGFRKNTPKILTIYFYLCQAVMILADNTTLKAMRGPFGSWIIAHIIVAILIYLNYTYFKKREHLFCN